MLMCLRIYEEVFKSNQNGAVNMLVFLFLNNEIQLLIRLCCSLIKYLNHLFETLEKKQFFKSGLKLHDFCREVSSRFLFLDFNNIIPVTFGYFHVSRCVRMLIISRGLINKLNPPFSCYLNCYVVFPNFTLYNLLRRSYFLHAM